MTDTPASDRPSRLSKAEPASLYTAFGAAAGGNRSPRWTAPTGPCLPVPAFEPGFTSGVRAAAGELDGNPNTVEVSRRGRAAARASACSPST